MLEISTALMLGIIAAGGVAAVVLIARGDPDHDDEVAAAELLAGIGDAPDPGTPAATAVPAWSLVDTIQMPAHRALGRLAYEELGTEDRDYQPRHGLDPDDGAEIPPSMVPALELMTPLERARELVRQLNQARWHPWIKLPRLERIRFVAATVAARNGVPLLLGQLAPVGRLP